MLLQARGPRGPAGCEDVPTNTAPPRFDPLLAHAEIAVNLSRFLDLHAELCDDWRVPSPDWFAKLGRYVCLRSELTRGGVDVELELRHRFPLATGPEVSPLEETKSSPTG